MVDESARLEVGHPVHGLEPAEEIAFAEAFVGQIDRCVAVQAGARLLRHVLALGVHLVVEHVGVAALLAKVDGKGIAGPDGLEPRVLLEPLARDDRTGIGLSRGALDSLAAAVARAHLIHRAQVEVVLLREVLAPDGGIVDRVVDLDHAEERVARLLLAFEDVDEQRRRARGHEHDDDRHEHDQAQRLAARGLRGLVLVHLRPPCDAPLDQWRWPTDRWHLRHSTSLRPGPPIIWSTMSA